jgi:hypothetical protein
MGLGADRHRRGLWLALLVLVCAGAAAGLALSAAPAQAYQEWQHGGAAPCTFCHSNGAPTNATCTQCHLLYKTIGSLTCWACHAPGQDMSFAQTAAGCASICHLYAGGGPDDYTIPVAHGPTPHLGASGYGKTCTDCHATSAASDHPVTDPDGSPHHDGLVQGAPTCEQCHNGTDASAQQPHDGLTCQTCHGDTMSLPPLSNAFCQACHENPADTTGATQIVFTGTLNCYDAACHGTAVLHTTSPQMTKTCTDCHPPHYQGLGSCTTCHSDVEGYHHGTAQPTPLKDCTACHNGTLAPTVANHDAVKPACTACHLGMDIPPQPATCNRCHPAATFDGRTCTSCHSPSGIFKQEQVHNAKPDTAPCTRCHAGYQKHAGAVACTTCHPKVTKFHHKVVSSPGFKQCTACHAKTHAGRAIAASKCPACHKGTRPSAKPRAQHSKTVKKLRKCSACHSQRAHASALAKVTCSSCHTGKYHRRMPIPTSSVCYKCHSAARAHAVGFACTVCHRNLQHNPRPSAGSHRGR